MKSFHAPRSLHRPVFVHALITGLILILLGPIAAQEDLPVNEAAESSTSLNHLSESRIQELLKTAQEQAGADDDVRQKQVGIYKQALEQLQQGDQWTSRALDVDNARIQAPTIAARLKQELSEADPEPKPNTPSNASLQQLEQLMAGPQQELADAQKLASDLSAEVKRRGDRRIEIPRLVSAARQRLDELKTEDSTGPLPDEPGDLTSARLLLVQARRHAAQQELQAYEKELQSYDARSELLTLRQDDASRRVARLEKLVREWQALVNEKRRGEAEEAAREARAVKRASANAHPLVRKLTEENAALTERRTGDRGLSARIEQVSQELQDTNSSLELLREQASGLKSKVEAVGLSDAIGILLRKQRDEAASLLQSTRRNGARRPDIAETHLKLLELDDELSALRDFEAAVRSTMADVPEKTAADETPRDELEAAVRELLQVRRSYLQALIKEYNSYFTRLIEVDTQEKHLREEAQRHANYIDERILWIPSSSAFSLNDRERAVESLYSLVSSGQWNTAWKTFAKDVASRPSLYLLSALVPIALLGSRRRLWSALEENCQKAGRSGSFSFYPVFRAGAATLLLAISVPFAVWFVGWRLQAAGNGSGFVQATAEGIMAAAVAFLALELVRTASSQRGLAATCFQWSSPALRTLRRNVLWLAAVALPIRVLVEIAQWHGGEIREESVARLLFMAGMIPCSLFAHKILQPSRGVLSGTIAKDESGWIYRLRHLWYVAGVGTPLLLAAAAFVGYQYTALHLGTRLLTTIWLCLGLIALNALLVHWLVITRRKLALQEARRRWQAEREEEDGEMPSTVEEPVIDVSRVAVQANRFLRSSMAFTFVLGLWLIWVDVLPALGILRGYELWTHQVQATEAITGPNGTRTLQIIDRVEAITLIDALFAAVMVLMTVVAARNLPGILEITILQRLNLDNGARYAVATISRYTITLVGGVVALRAIGVGWNNVQWMAAAITVGLGFGLQEIFANFISGLILLFERPIRAGDVVMVNGILGKVGLIQIRATTIVDMDHKELIIPNKEFITGQVINYTLSDTVIRLTVTVGVAYGSDYDEARRILLRLAHEHPITLSDPQPIAALAEFKDSSVEFLLFVHLPDLNNFLSVRHDLIAGIEREFTRAGVRIPFPQRDLHVRGFEESLPAALGSSTASLSKVVEPVM